MADETLYDTGAPTIEVRIYRGDNVLARELCETEQDVEAVIESYASVENVSVVVDDLSSKHGPGDVLAPEEPRLDEDDG